METVCGSFRYDGAVPRVDGGKLLCILGPASNVWQDWEPIRGVEADLMAVNDIGAYIPESVRWWYSSHDDRLLAWARVRWLIHEERQRPALISCVKKEGIDYAWKPLDDELKMFSLGSSIESSGVFAMCIGLCMGYERIVLVGCPGDGSGHRFHPPYRAFPGYADPEARKAWQFAMAMHPEIPERVRSCSGMTKDLLGGP